MAQLQSRLTVLRARQASCEQVEQTPTVLVTVGHRLIVLVTVGFDGVGLVGQEDVLVG
jgi:hypothetical protein